MERKCDNCGAEYNVDSRNLKRGWGLCCSKSCAAKKREKNKTIKDVNEKIIQIKQQPIASQYETNDKNFYIPKGCQVIRDVNGDISFVDYDLDGYRYVR